ncbi:hypothetical protein J2Y45_003857 [Dyadobacter sp. BE34]|uniref:Uncharacterized protein n=1 Tax=Dyadobacter fermentans TaxID=94254 RepID=A0ABU1R293_9BACT|nr:hypothetical protein [Dyadobacter fermentans]MDR7044407.1 hypothetical protein [Dyadobacter sp. BE242]MDR7198717.1 hypothetical protein [Dyadobacter sp. BE34]MDR7216679.1 hypothetical protein [Dyadobacter sp. BE31]MDR7263795.1 hypothetical protein [Dyadobacter sp. BE32]
MSGRRFPRLDDSKLAALSPGRNGNLAEPDKSAGGLDSQDAVPDNKKAAHREMSSFLYC